MTQTEAEYVAKIEAKNRAMQKTIVGRANAARDLRPRDVHCGYRVLARREGYYEVVRNGVTQSRKHSFICDVETPYSAEMRVFPFRDLILSEVAKLPLSGEFEGPEPKLHGMKLTLPKHARFWVAVAYYSNEWIEV